MNEDDINFEGEFVSSFVQFSGCVLECECRTTHVAMDADEHWDWDPGEHELWKERAEADAANVVLHEGIHTLELITIDNANFVYGCTCEGWREYYNIILANRGPLSSFLADVDSRIEWEREKLQIVDILKTTHTDDNF